jgi:hypothetical protein
MQQSKPNNKPFWSVVILLIVVFALRVAMLITLVRMLHNTTVEGVISNIVWQAIITIIILAGEAVMYWVLRRRFYRMSWVWTHVILLYIILLVLPIAYVFLSFIMPRYLNPGLYAEWIAKFSVAQVIIYWIGIAISHFFFVLTIVYGFRKKNAIAPVQNEPSHLLDEFHK